MKKIILLALPLINAHVSLHAMEDTTSHLLMLPAETKMHILSYLGIRGLFTCKQTNRELLCLTESCTLAKVKRYLPRAQANMIEHDRFRGEDYSQSGVYPLFYELFFLAIEAGDLKVV